LAGWLECSLIQRARAAGHLEVHRHALRDYALDLHGQVDDYPYGGGAGMVLKPEPIFRAVEAVREQLAAAGITPPGPVILLTPQGTVFSQAKARELAAYPQVTLICGRYEGVDERVRQALVTEELSIGDYIVMGGELPAMVVMDAVARLVPGVLGDAESPAEESFSDGLLEYPHYTRPAEFRGLAVPEVLLSGHHERIRLWRRLQRLQRTLARRPKLLADVSLTAEDRRLLARILGGEER